MPELAHLAHHRYDRADSSVRALLACSARFGTVSSELCGHLVGTVQDAERYSDRAMADLAGLIGS